MLTVKDVKVFYFFSERKIFPKGSGDISEI